MKHSNSTLAKAVELRKNRFLAALRIAGMTMDEWARREKVSQGYVSNLIARRRMNEELDPKIDAFIAKHITKAA